MVPGPSVGLTVTGIAWEWESKLVSDQTSHMLRSTPLVTTPRVISIAPFVVESLAITPPCYRTIGKLAEVS